MIVWWSRRPPVEAEVASWLAATVEDVERLMRALDGRDRRARDAAARLLERLRLIDPRVAALGPLEEGPSAEPGGRPTASLGAETVMPLIGALNHAESETREVAAGLLGTLGDRRATAPLARALNDDLWFVRRAAAIALARLGDPRAVPALRTRALGEPVPGVRQACWDAARRLEGGISLRPTEVVPATAPHGAPTDPSPALGDGNA